jgi:2,3-bisphosphoglycerate-independent phosphoglycerate mutase
MAKKTPEPKTTGKNRRKATLWVVGSNGRQRFLRGIITHDLMQHGFEFEEAFAIARALRERLADHKEVKTQEIRALVHEHVEKVYGARSAARLVGKTVQPLTEFEVIYHGQIQPFSRGLLARSLIASGLDLDRAYRRVLDLESELRARGQQRISSEEIAQRVDELLARSEGMEAAHRYRLLRRIHRLSKPIVVYVGGASGTGKSTLALELAALLRIYRVTATDTVRQVMRSLFSPEILPAIHRSSFQTAVRPSGLDELEADQLDPTQPVITAFSEQAARIAVGVRAVVERAIAENMSILVEGVHLAAPMVPFPDLDDRAYQVSLVLATPNLEIHRSRFSTRGRMGSRRAERYLENFKAIRIIHDYLVEQAEAEDLAVVDTSFGEVTQRALRQITRSLQKTLPELEAPQIALEGLTPTLVVFIDGMADNEIPALGGKTPLAAATKPTLDRLAREGSCGLTDSIAPGVVPDTAAGTLALFGQEPLGLKRGPIEAAGAGIELLPSDIALRANLATLDADGKIVDRRAGRIRQESLILAKAIDELELPGVAGQIEILVRPATEHRLAIVLRGSSLSDQIRGSDPGEAAPAGTLPLRPAALDPENDDSAFTAKVLEVFEMRAREILATHPVNIERVRQGLMPANAILTRGAGRLERLTPLEVNGRRLSVTCIAGERTILGLASLVGAQTEQTETMTGSLDTDLNQKFAAAERALNDNQLVVVHVKGADIAAHDRKPEQKQRFIEKVDRALGGLLERRSGRPFRVVVASDHATLSDRGVHGDAPSPILIWGPGITADAVESFDEKSVARGALGRFVLRLLLRRLFPLGPAASIVAGRP